MKRKIMEFSVSSEKFNDFLRSAVVDGYGKDIEQLRYAVRSVYPSPFTYNIYDRKYDFKGTMNDLKKWLSLLEQKINQLQKIRNKKLEVHIENTLGVFFKETDNI